MAVNESHFTRELLRELGGMPHAKVYKWADRFAVGRPDLSVSSTLGTTWVELKFIRGTRLDIKFTKHEVLQLEEMCDLYTVCNNAFYIIWFENPAKVGRYHTEFWNPQALKSFWKKTDLGSLPFHVEEGKAYVTARKLLIGR